MHYALQRDPRRGLPRRAGALTRARRPRPSPRSPRDVDLVLCMTVNPGWGGQAFLAALARQDRAAARADRRRAGARGRRRDRRRDRRRAAPRPGATVFVAGTAVFGAEDPAARSARSRPRSAGTSGRRTWYGQPYVDALLPRSQSSPRGLHRPHRRRPPVLSGQRARAARGRGVRRHRRGRGRRVRRSPRPAGCGPRSCCSTCSCPTSTASTSPRALTGDAGRADRDPRLEPRLVGLRPARRALRRPRLRAEGRALGRPRPGAAP